MKIQAIETKIWWICLADEIRPVRGVSVVDAVRKFSEAFQFAGAPTQLPGATEGYRFSEGSASVNDTKVAIREVTIFNDGLSVHVYSHSKDADAVLNQVLGFLKQIGFRNPETPPKISYNSTIIFDLGKPLNSLVANFEPLSKTIHDVMGMALVPEVRAIEFSVDPRTAPPLSPKTFKIERRAEVPFELNRYFSFAACGTDQHIRLLEDIEARLN